MELAESKVISEHSLFLANQEAAPNQLKSSYQVVTGLVVIGDRQLNSESLWRPILDSIPNYKENIFWNRVRTFDIVI